MSGSTSLSYDYGSMDHHDGGMSATPSQSATGGSVTDVGLNQGPSGSAGSRYSLDGSMDEEQQAEIIQRAITDMYRAKVSSKALREKEAAERKRIAEERGLKLGLTPKALRELKTRVRRSMRRARVRLVTTPWTKRNKQGQEMPVFAWFRKDKIEQTRSLTYDMIVETWRKCPDFAITTFMNSKSRRVPWDEGIVLTVFEDITAQRSKRRDNVTFAAAKYVKDKAGNMVIKLPGGFEQPEQPTEEVAKAINDYAHTYLPQEEMRQRFSAQRKKLKALDVESKAFMDRYMEANNVGLTTPFSVPQKDGSVVEHVIERRVREVKQKEKVPVSRAKEAIRGIIAKYRKKFERYLDNEYRKACAAQPGASISRIPYTFCGSDTEQLKIFVQRYREKIAHDILALKKKVSHVTSLLLRPMTEKDRERLRAQEEALQAMEEGSLAQAEARAAEQAGTTKKTTRRASRRAQRATDAEGWGASAPARQARKKKKQQHQAKRGTGEQHNKRLRTSPLQE
jgi:hypothetical protein